MINYTDSDYSRSRSKVVCFPSALFELVTSGCSLVLVDRRWTIYHCSLRITLSSKSFVRPLFSYTQPTRVAQPSMFSLLCTLTVQFFQPNRRRSSRIKPHRMPRRIVHLNYPPPSSLPSFNPQPSLHQCRCHHHGPSDIFIWWGSEMRAFAEPGRSWLRCRASVPHQMPALLWFQARETPRMRTNSCPLDFQILTH